MSSKNHIASPAEWRAASRADRRARAELLRLPSGATILAARPQPLEWILSGRLPQRLLAVALEDGRRPAAGAAPEISREEILDLARFARQLVEASIVEPPVGEGPGEIPLDDIPVEDRAFVFEWACRSLAPVSESPAPHSLAGGSQASPTGGGTSTQEDLSSLQLERFRQK
jgi:hypothetical protein